MYSTQLSDKELISKYISGSEAALEQIITRHKERVFSYLCMMLKDHELANDMFQDTFVKVVKTLRNGNYNEEGKFLPWVLRIAHNLVIDHFRKSKRMPLSRGNDEYDIFDTISESEPNADRVMVWEQVKTDLGRLVDELPEEQKEVLVMRMYRDMSFKEIAFDTGVSINTALGRMRYALINLRKLIEKNNVALESL